ncbi:hypothetical protein LCGC14_1189270, partial [marine sediment metagenome]
TVNDLSLNYLQDLCEFMNKEISTFEKITKYIKSPVATKICSTMTKDEHINSMSKVILEINKDNDAKYLAEIIHNLQRKVFEYENKIWKN